MFAWIILFQFLADNLFINKFISVNNCCIHSVYRNDVECKLRLCSSNYLLSILPSLTIITITNLPSHLGLYLTLYIRLHGGLQTHNPLLGFSFPVPFLAFKVSKFKSWQRDQLCVACPILCNFYAGSVERSSGEWGQCLKW